MEELKTVHTNNPGKPVFPVLVPVTLISFVLFDTDLYYTVAAAIFFHQFISFYFNLNERIPLRNLAGMMFTLNYLFGPALMFHWLNPFVEDNYSMRGNAEDYFTYAIPAMLLFLAGLYIFAKKEEEEININRIRAILDRYPWMPLQFIIAGVLASFSLPYIPSQLQFVVSSLAYLKFIGMFLSLLSPQRINFLYLALSYGVLFLQSFSSSMFNDLLNMLFFLAIYLCIKYKPSGFLKIGGIVAGLVFLSFIQSIKFLLREQESNSIENLQKIPALVQKVQSKKLSTDEKVANIIFRLSQGWVTSSSIEYKKNNGFEFQNGNHSLTILRLALMPRIIDPDRMVVGDGTFFNLYSGHTIREGTSIALGILTDGFIDYGQNGIFIVFIFGLIINGFIKFYNFLDDKYALAKVFLPVCFFYIRPDTDTFSSLGAAVKTTFVIAIVLFITYKFYLQDKVSMNEQEVYE